ncbi:MAG: hypothetical protein DMG40_20310 [Acidobacteria bacterium]|nr:MAG: hypothetical protein DMG40_20310 [Acidobacteriota bacterium]
MHHASVVGYPRIVLEPPLSASIGVALSPEDGETMEALLRAADGELYRMKWDGQKVSIPSVCGMPSEARRA